MPSINACRSPSFHDKSIFYWESHEIKSFYEEKSERVTYTHKPNCGYTNFLWGRFRGSSPECSHRCVIHSSTRMQLCRHTDTDSRTSANTWSGVGSPETYEWLHRVKKETSNGVGLGRRVPNKLEVRGENWRQTSIEEGALSMVNSYRTRISFAVQANSLDTTDGVGRSLAPAFQAHENFVGGLCRLPVSVAMNDTDQVHSIMWVCEQIRSRCICSFGS